MTNSSETDLRKKATLKQNQNSPQIIGSKEKKVETNTELEDSRLTQYVNFSTLTLPVPFISESCIKRLT